MSTMTAPTPDDIANATPAEDETLWERRMRALTMRNAGATYHRIAQQLGVSTATARKDVRLALREVINETAEDMLARQRSILHDVVRTNYPAMLQRDNDATKHVIDSLKHEAQLFGLYAPTRVAVGVSDTEFAEQTAELMGKLGLEPPKELIKNIPAPTIDAEVVEPEVPQQDSFTTPTDLETPDADTPVDPSAPDVDPADGWSNL